MKHCKKSGIFLALLTLLLVSTVNATPAVKDGEDHVGKNGKRGTDRVVKPGVIRVETLGEGGIIMRWGVGAREILTNYNLVYKSGKNVPTGTCSTRVARFKKVSIRSGMNSMFEGRVADKRKLGVASDDDWELKEDRPGSVDNDGDGHIDEGFVAIGERIYTAQVALKEYGRKVLTKCYTWPYESAIDFVGVTSIFENRSFKEDYLGKGEEVVLSLGINFIFGGLESRVPDISVRTVSEIGVTGDSLRGIIFSRDSLFAGVVLLDSKPQGLVSPRIVFSLNSNGGNDSLLVLEKRDGISLDSDNGEGLKVAAMRFVLENIGGHKNGKTGKIEWAILFANSEREIKRNMKLALKTYEGTVDKNGRSNWVVPPIRTSRINLDTELATVWRENKKERAVVMKTPFDLVDISIKWIKIDGLKTSKYTKVGSDILVPIGNTPGNKEDSIRIEGEFTNGILFFGETIGVAEGERALETTPDDGRLPQSFMKLYPNPFVEKVNIILSIPGSEDIKVSNSKGMFTGNGTVRIYDVKGMLVQRIIDRKVFYPGEYSVSWDGTDRRGEPVAPGVYYCNLQIDSKTLTKRIVLIR